MLCHGLILDKLTKNNVTWKCSGGVRLYPSLHSMCRGSASHPRGVTEEPHIPEGGADPWVQASHLEAGLASSRLLRVLPARS